MHRTAKRREQRWRKTERELTLQWLEKQPNAVLDALAASDHPKLTEDEHSMLSYVYWLIEHNYTNKAKEIVNAHACSN
jgi:hypothetical protein